jgi:hypothetical protein
MRNVRQGTMPIPFNRLPESSLNNIAMQHLPNLFRVSVLVQRINALTSVLHQGTSHVQLQVHFWRKPGHPVAFCPFVVFIVWPLKAKHSSWSD